MTSKTPSLSTHPRRIFGIDPGLQVTGYAILEVASEGPKICEAGVVRSDQNDLAIRVKTLYEGISEALDQWMPSAVVVEQLYAHYDHPRTAILMAHARGAYLLAGAQRGIPVVSYAATRVKKLVTGSGRAGKQQMQMAVARELKLPGPPEPHDVADALAIALCHYFATATILHGSTSATFTAVREDMLRVSDPDLIEERDNATAKENRAR